MTTDEEEYPLPLALGWVTSSVAPKKPKKKEKKRRKEPLGFYKRKEDKQTWPENKD